MIESLIIFITVLIGNGVDTIIGGGGGLMILPVLILSGFEPIVAVSSMVTFFIGALIAGLFRLRKSELFHYEKKYLSYVGISCLGGITGGLIAIDLDPVLFKRIIAIALFSMLIFWISPKKIKISKHHHKWIASIAFFIIGIYNAMIGSGAGLLLSFGYLFTTGKGLKQILTYRLINALFLNSIIAIFYIWQNKVDFQLTLIGLFASLIGGYVGVHYFIKIPEKPLRILFSIIAIVSMLSMLAL